MPKGKRQRNPSSPDPEASMAKRSKSVPPEFSDAVSMVTFFIGNKEEGNQKKFLVHKDVICSQSPVLKAAFDNKLTDGGTQTYAIEDVNEHTFKMFMEWLYSKTITLVQVITPIDNKPQIPQAQRDMKTNEDLSLCQLWVLGHKLSLPEMQDVAIESMLRAVRINYDLDSVVYKYAYEKTPVDSELRKFLVAQIVANRPYPSWFDKERNALPADFLFDFAKACLLYMPMHRALVNPADFYLSKGPHASTVLGIDYSSALGFGFDSNWERQTDKE
ncbi:hypothetical protein BJ875DRAFT_511108 [Amylocarpus encephaloides]|uniref:BTB domain-containing protein n=1 Tax=Amylocarpus encephaloides TaxID=45428 RepID=A0A9P8C9L5_9HELO|nr:hypothetical protein BJ875DRAFT_511108 [Amylocarpus encephaloides]